VVDVGHRALSGIARLRTNSAMRSAIMIVGMLVLVCETPGIIDAMNWLFAATTFPLGLGGTDEDRPCCVWTWRPP
jgi:hypothetical protein